MKTLFIPAQLNSKIIPKEIKALNLPKNIGIAYSVQYQKIAIRIKKILSENHKITKFIQILGCSKPVFPKDTQAILAISSGRFHSISLAFKTKIPVYVFEGGNLTKISNEEINSFEKRKRGSYLKFLHSEKIGVLISTKPGQENLKKALSLKDELKKKKTYLFISNELNLREFENFPDIRSWINTACPRMDLDSSVVNISGLNFCNSKNSL